MLEQERIARLRRVIAKLNDEIVQMEKTIARKTFGKMTIQEIGAKWDRSSPAERIDMICDLPEFQAELDRGESYGGLTRGEIEQNVLECKWDQTEEAEIDKAEIFGEYCKK